MKDLQVTDKVKMEVIKYFGYENYENEKNHYMSEAPDDLFVFYYNCMMKNIDVCDADRYASLNTVLGYDVGFNNFREIDLYLWGEKDFDLMDLFGNENGKQIVEEAVKVLNLDIDFSKWNNEDIESYAYYNN